MAKLEDVLAPLSVAGNGESDKVEKAVEKADKVFLHFLEEERQRLEEYEKKKVELALDKETERRLETRAEKEALKTSSKKYKTFKRKIEEAIQNAGDGVTWVEVTGKRIKGVDDVYRYKYYEARKKQEADDGKMIVEPTSRRHIERMEVSKRTILSIFSTPCSDGLVLVFRSLTYHRLSSLRSFDFVSLGPSMSSKT